MAYLTMFAWPTRPGSCAETNRSIADIASEAGFSDQSYFDKRFRRAFGSTPKDFRAEAGALNLS